MAIKKIPLSMTGDNLYSFKCDATERHCQYAVCQHTVWAFKQERLKGFEDCRDAIERRACPAIKMMLAEKKANKAMFFESYEALVKARKERLELAEEEAHQGNKWRGSIIASRRTAIDEDEIRRRDQQIEAKIRAESEDSVEKRIKKSRAKRSESANLNDSGNMFAEIVNELASKEAS